jgi:hypothetical protein
LEEHGNGTIFIAERGSGRGRSATRFGEFLRFLECRVLAELSHRHYRIGRLIVHETTSILTQRKLAFRDARQLGVGTDVKPEKQSKDTQ